MEDQKYPSSLSSSNDSSLFDKNLELEQWLRKMQIHKKSAIPVMVNNSKYKTQNTYHS